MVQEHGCGQWIEQVTLALPVYWARVDQQSKPKHCPRRMGYGLSVENVMLYLHRPLYRSTHWINWKQMHRLSLEGCIRGFVIVMLYWVERW